MTLSKQHKKELKQQAHHLKPIIMIGNKGLTEAVQLEIERALLDHELIKIKINADDRESRHQMAEEICQKREAEFVHAIGHIVIVYRQSDD